ncbi:metalloenzyme [bacterium]|nr:metalloenzyme [bacterium]
MSVLLFFIDGLGIGPDDPEINPCAVSGMKYFSISDKSLNGPLEREGVLVAADANLGVPGLPQSATGQVTLFTGINAAAHIGRHLPGFPNESLRTLLKEHSLLLRVKERGLKPVFINTFRPLFFELPPGLQWKMSASTCSALSANLPFFNVDSVARGKTVYHDYTNEGLIRRGFDVPRFTPERAGEVLADSLHTYDLVLYEYFLTDKAAHARDMERALELLRGLDLLLDRLLERTDLSRHTVIVTSDHGNIEDLSQKPHTRNPVPVMIWGPGTACADTITSIEHITPAILGILAASEGELPCRA